MLGETDHQPGHIGLDGLDGPPKGIEVCDAEILAGLLKRPVLDNDFDEEAAATKNLKKRYRPDLRTIRESPERIYIVTYFDMNGDNEVIEEHGVLVPEPVPAIPGVTILEIEEEVPDLNNEEDLEAENEVANDVIDVKFEEAVEEQPPVEKDVVIKEATGVVDLKKMNERADRLCQELKLLNSEDDKKSAEAEDAQDNEVKEIMRQYSDFIIILSGDEGNGDETPIGLEALPQDDEVFLSSNTDEDDNEKSEKKSDEVAKSQHVDEAEINPEKVIQSLDDEERNGENIGENFLDENESKLNQQDTDADAGNTNPEKLSEINHPVEVPEIIIDTATNENEGEPEISVESANIKEVEDMSKTTESIEIADAHENDIVENDSIKDDDQKVTTENDTSETVKASETVLDDEEKDLTFEELLEKLQNFKPKRPRKPTSQFPDLSVEGEAQARLKSYGAGHYWRMPFRHGLFAQHHQQ